MPDNSWKIRKRTTIYECPPYLKLERQTVELSDGRVIDDYHRLEMPEATVIYPMTDDGRVVMLRAYRHGIGGTTLMLPGGLLVDTEMPIDAAKRELLEETGYVSEYWTSLGDFIPHINYGCGRLHVFKCTSIQKKQIANSGDLETSKIELSTEEEARELTKFGQIRALSSMAAISLAMCSDL